MQQLLEKRAPVDRVPAEEEVNTFSKPWVVGRAELRLCRGPSFRRMAAVGVLPLPVAVVVQLRDPEEAVEAGVHRAEGLDPVALLTLDLRRDLGGARILGAATGEAHVVGVQVEAASTFNTAGWAPVVLQECQDVREGHGVHRQVVHPDVRGPGLRLRHRHRPDGGNQAGERVHRFHGLGPQQEVQSVAHAEEVQVYVPGGPGPRRVLRPVDATEVKDVGSHEEGGQGLLRLPLQVAIPSDEVDTRELAKEANPALQLGPLLQRVRRPSIEVVDADHRASRLRVRPLVHYEAVVAIAAGPQQPVEDAVVRQGLQAMVPPVWISQDGECVLREDPKGVPNVLVATAQERRDGDVGGGPP
mmetsp:Transcript_18381/g.57846  ORF Transcript_18381/g.57846 Transcript_18381/m.57846 type:complete len:358 (+) Transcript_18381:1089-2162(+)